MYNGSSWDHVNATPIEDLSTPLYVENTELNVRVYAVNEYCQGPPTKCTFNVPRRDVPGCPEPPKVKLRSEHKATLIIIPPVDDGGLSITRYVVEMKGVSATRWRTSGYVEEVEGDLEFTVTGIEPSCYEFRVIAINGAGSGQPSPAVLSEFGNYYSNIFMQCDTCTRID